MIYLNRDRLRHVDMLEPLRLGSARVIAGDGEGGLIYHEAGRVYMISAASEERVRELADRIPSAQLLCLHQPFLAEELALRYGLPERMDCHQALYAGCEPPEAKAPAGFCLSELTLEELPQVMAHYENAGEDPSYIRERIREGMLGAFDSQGRLAGFVGCHGEGAMGLLEVLPAYRQKGLGRALQGAMIARQLARNRLPYGQVVRGNVASLALQRSLGMRITQDAPVIWLCG